MGEGGTIGAPAAIADAVTDALAPLGIDISSLPATPNGYSGSFEQSTDKSKGN